MKKLTSFLLAFVMVLGIIGMIPLQTNAAGTGEMIELTVQVGENATGSVLSYDILWFTDSAFTYQEGDRLEYDVWVSHDLAGIGGLELCSGSYTLRDNGAVDANGIYVHPDFADISGYAHNRWYSRSIGIPNIFAGADFSAGGPALIATVSIADCAALAGETVKIYYDNIRITRNGETVQAIYPGLHSSVAANPGDYVAVTNPNVAVSYAVTTQISTPEPKPEPPVSDSQFIKMAVEIGENAAGSALSYDILWFTDSAFTYQAGDRLEYDVWMSHDVAGIGSLELCSGAYTLRDNGAVDSNGIYAHPDFCDVSDYAYGKWYSRSIGIPDIFAGADFSAGGPAVIVPVSLADCSALAGETVTVCYDNIRITRNGETVQAIYPGLHFSVAADPSDYVALNNGNVAIAYEIATQLPEIETPTDPTEPTLPEPPAADQNVLDMAIQVPAGAKGVYSNYDILYFMDYDIRFQKGDKLEYDVYLTHDMGGIGGMDLCFGYDTNQVLRGNAVDDKGLGAHPASDLSGQAFGKWYNRAIAIPDCFVGVEFTGAGPAVILAAEIPDAAQAAGKTIHVYYDNIRITRNGEVIRYIYPGQNNDAPTNITNYFKHDPNGLGVNITYTQTDSLSGELTKPAPGTTQKPAANPLKLSSGKSGTALAMNVQIPEGAIGLYTNYEIGYYTPSSVRLKEGDKLEYDVYLSHDIAGIGGLEFCFGYEDKQVLRGTAVDDLGVGAHPAADLSDLAYGQWYNRAIELPEHFLNRSYTGAGPALIFAVELADCAKLAGETVTVYYDNIRITRNGETIYEIYPDNSNSYPTNTVYYHTHNPGSLDIKTTFTQVPRNDIQPLDLTPEEQEVIQFTPVKPAETQPEQTDTDVPAATEPVQTSAGSGWLLPLILIILAVCVAVAVVIVILAVKKKKAG